ncbi:MAG TPA: hypothetical protein VF160_01420 [Candidatus Dormibacteraeota bacterium]
MGALGAAFGEWLRGLPLYAGIAAAVWIPYQAVELLLALVLGVASAGATVQAAGVAAAADRPFDEAGAVAAAGRLLLLGAVTLVLALVASALSQAAVALAVEGRLRGAAPAVGDALRAGWARTGAVLGATFLMALVGLAAVVVVLVVGLPLTFALGLVHLAPVGTGLTALGLIGGPVVLISAFAVAPQVAAIEGLGPVASVRRGRRLIGGQWPVALLLIVVLGAVAWLGSALLTGLLQAAVGGRTGTLSVVVGGGAAALAAVVLGPLPQVGLTLLYDRLRTRERP